jgi:hypothetical chaperone protein
MIKLSAGIDFGTTNTTAAITGGDKAPHVVPIENDDSAIPSTIFFEENGNRVFFGREAMKKYMDGESGRFMRSLKRVLGSNLMKTGTIVNGRAKTFQSIIGAFVENLKAKLDIAADQDIEQVVMGRPVRFRDNDPKGDEQAEKELEQIARNTGFKDVLFQYEPIAAAFAHERYLKEEQLAAVIDIGGGTSDFTIIRLGGARATKTDRKDDILANTGVRIGGNDFDKQLSLKTFMPEFGMNSSYNSGTNASPKILPVPTTHHFDLSEWSQVNSLYTYKNMNSVRKYLAFSQSPEKYGRLLEVLEKQLGHKVLAVVEDTKIDLTDRTEIEVSLDFLSSSTKIPATRAEFEKSIEQHTVKILDAVRECVNLAGINPAKVQLIVLTGGSTEIPYIRQTLCSVFPNAKVSAEDRLSSVGLGLAFDAARRFGNKSR